MGKSFPHICEFLDQKPSRSEMVTRGDLFGPRSSSPPSYQTAPACDLTSEGPHFSDLSSSHPSSVIRDLTATHSRRVFTPEVPPVPGVSYLAKSSYPSRSRPFLQLETSSFGYKSPSYMFIFGPKTVKIGDGHPRRLFWTKVL